ncbi:MAG: tRNA uridine-5-carboxymethylaminomethyl(34) synthesis GTPase MnmE [Pseudomonadales bacterium]|nr:tRNA uridine-5-carboxymethylaminomethyl(34) synthesis GTPase MnmE [Pseudomonadales bacterium]
MVNNVSDTICAIATAAGRGGIGIVRISGAQTTNICLEILGFKPTPRHAHSTNFLDKDGRVIDSGIAIFYQAPNSFTGEDILELQGHGGAQILNEVLERVLSFGVRQAHPGEFSERAFLNDKIDLVQAEAIADLIDASSKQAAKSAMRTLQGEFSRRVGKMQEQLIATRVNVEAAIDFSDEDIDILSDTGVATAIQETKTDLEKVFEQAQQGVILREGMKVVIAGRPNAGKSSLLNALAGEDSAIVTAIPGTTRDVLRVETSIEGMPIHIIDTAGLRSSEDIVEQEGIKRAEQAIVEADQILLVIDASIPEKDVDRLLDPLTEVIGKSLLTPDTLKNISFIQNKIDLLNNASAAKTTISVQNTNYPQITLSAKSGTGLQLLRNHLKQIIGYQPSESGDFVARERHLKALRSAKEFIISVELNLSKHSPLEVIAEDLRLAQKALGAITGEFSSDDLLGEIFSSFCVGK